MELPLSVLVILILGIIVVIAIFAGIILPSSSGLNAASNSAEFTVTCNEWGAQKCSKDYFSGNQEKIEKAARCQGYDACKAKCSASGLC